jgi:hypothetical protein
VRRSRSLPLFLMCALVAATLPLRASGPVFWTVATSSDFLAGTSDGVFVSLQGVLTPGPSMTSRLSTTPAQVWSLAQADDGTLFAIRAVCATPFATLIPHRAPAQAASFSTRMARDSPGPSAKFSAGMASPSRGHGSAAMAWPRTSRGTTRRPTTRRCTPG